MGDYAYISKDESYALKHYGVKGMKWHKHLKRRFEAETGIAARRALDATGQMRYNSMVDDAKNGNYSGSKRTRDLERQQDYRKSKYDKTPLGRIEKRLMKLDRGDDRVANAVDNTISALTNKKKSQKQLDREANRRKKKNQKRLDKYYKKLDDQARRENMINDRLSMMTPNDYPSTHLRRAHRTAVAKSNRVAEEYSKIKETSAEKAQKRRNAKRIGAKNSLDLRKKKKNKTYAVSKWGRR